MKKLLSFAVVLFAVIAVNAQNFLFQESFEADAIPSNWVTIDNDGDGNNWYTIYGNDYAQMAHTGIGHATSASWASSAFTPDNYLISEGIAIPANANQPTLSWWAKGQDPSYAAEHYAVYISTTGQTAADFSTAVYEGEPTGDYVQHTVDLSSYAGQTIYVAFRHYNVTDMFRLNIDDIEVYTVPTEPTLTVTPTSIDFGTVVLGQTASNTASVTAYNLTGNIAISTEAPYAVSLDGSSYATSVSMPAAGGTLYVQFAPTSANAANGTVSLTSGTLTATISLTGSGFECGTITTFPYNCTFAEDDATLTCWEIIDANGDANVEGEDQGTWNFTGSGWSSDNDGVAQYFYSQANAADDWLISPEFRGVGLSASFDYLVRDATYPEEFSVYVIAPGQTYNNATEVIAAQSYTNEEFEQHTINLSAYDNQDIRIAIHATSAANMYGIVIDNFVVSGATDITEIDSPSLSIYPNPATTILNVEAEGFSTIEMVNVLGQVVYSANATSNMQINVSNLDNGVYFVRLNGANGTATQKFIKK